MPESRKPERAHDDGGTYAPEDFSVAAERSRLRDTQNYRQTAAQVDLADEGDGSGAKVKPGSQLDTGTS